MQTGAQRTTGYELGASGEITPSWQLVGGFSSQTARIRNRTTAAAGGRDGAARAALDGLAVEPRAARARRRRGPRRGAPGAHVRGDRQHASRCPRSPASMARCSSASRVRTRAQLNVENLLDTRYYATSQGNNNIMPGASRTLRLSLSADF